MKIKMIGQNERKKKELVKNREACFYKKDFLVKSCFVPVEKNDDVWAKEKYYQR